MLSTKTIPPVLKYYNSVKNYFNNIFIFIYYIYIFSTKYIFVTIIFSLETVT